jgi:membrane protein YdbS with pleckstrin-like domain
MFGLIVLSLFLSIFGIMSLAETMNNGGNDGTNLFLAMIFFLPFIWIPIGLLILYAIVRYIYEIYYLQNYFYDLSGKNLMIRKGVFTKEEIVLPIARLQDVYVDQDILDRIFGLYDLHVSSATTISGVLSHIDGLNKENANIIKNLILSGIHKENE